MDERLQALYGIPNMEDYEADCVRSLRESSVMLENRMHEIIERLPEQDRQIIEAYWDIRNELEFQSVKLALRWGKRNYK